LKQSLGAQLPSLETIEGGHGSNMQALKAVWDGGLGYRWVHISQIRLQLVSSLNHSRYNLTICTHPKTRLNGESSLQQLLLLFASSLIHILFLPRLVPRSILLKLPDFPSQVANCRFLSPPSTVLNPHDHTSGVRGERSCVTMIVYDIWQVR
jgi:hypothetical protein